MLKKTITYTDWNGEERTEDFYFNLTRVEIYELEYDVEPGTSLTEVLDTLVKSKDYGRLIGTIKKVILTAYGEKSADGKRFMKGEDIRRSFEENPAFDELYMSLITDPKKIAEFIVGIMPSSVRDNLGSDPTYVLVKQIEARIGDRSE